MAADQQLVVCGLSDVPRAVQVFKANALVSVLHPDLIPETPADVPASNHFRLHVDDIDGPFSGLTHATPDGVAALCRFAQQWRDGHLPSGPGSARDRALVVHCFVGVSRSTAAAFAMMCAFNPAQPERKLANYLRSASPAASPNRLIVELADHALGRNGRMINAIRAIGAGSAAAKPSPFALAANLADMRDAA